MFSVEKATLVLTPDGISWPFATYHICISQRTQHIGLLIINQRIDIEALWGLIWHQGETFLQSSGFENEECNVEKMGERYDEGFSTSIQLTSLSSLSRNSSSSTSTGLLSISRIALGSFLITILRCLYGGNLRNIQNSKFQKGVVCANRCNRRRLGPLRNLLGCQHFF